MGGHHGPQRLEDVVDWALVVRKYQSIKGIEEHDKPVEDEDHADRKVSADYRRKVSGD